ncbi:hypothetical protein [Sphingobacterium cellulitidis]|uniref:hypothetical protein n=1 Tax=Sphingobacterium cellulitidis TaxID=1768011 RepID=UPI000B945BF0|nr:hypothetical protein CHT99_10420 [Sphingobacterium cellulitidis]
MGNRSLAELTNSLKLTETFYHNPHNQMERLTIKELAPYLPYGLKVIGFNSYVNKDMVCDLTDRNLWTHIENQSKPLLRPLSTLTEEIEHNGERFVPYDTSVFARHRMNTLHPKCINIVGMPYWCVTKLLEWHFDVFGLIDRGLALPIDGKEVEPLTCGYCDSKFSKGTGGNYGEYGDVCINCYEGLS